MLCATCGLNVALGRVAGPIRGQWCYACLRRHATGRMNKMAEQKDNGPYTVYGRRTPNEQEVQLGSHDDLDQCKSRANDMVDSSVWAHASVRDRNDQTVHVGEVTGGHDKGSDPDDGGPDV